MDTTTKKPFHYDATTNTMVPGESPSSVITQTTLAQDQAKAANQNKPGYDTLGNPIPGYKAPVQEDTSTKSTLDTQKAEVETLSQKRLADAEAANARMVGIQNGSIPLSAGENAQIEGLKQQFNQMIEQQKLTNTGATGTANIRGYQQGASEYDPNFQTNIIKSVIDAGANKVMDLNVKMASAVATLTQALKDNNIKSIKDAYTVLDDARKARQVEIQKTVDDTQKAIKEAQDAQIAADKVVFDTVTKPIQDIAMDVAKNGNGALAAEIRKTGSVTEALKLAGDYLQTATGTLGDYLQYKRGVEAKGLVPEEYDTWRIKEEQRQAKVKSSEAYNTAYNTAAGKAAAEAKYAGLSGDYTDKQKSAITKLNQDVSKNATYTKTTSMRNYGDNVIASLSLGSGVGDISAINQFQKVIDEGAVTRDQDVKLITSSQSLANSLKTKLKKLESGQQLSPELRKEMREAVEKMYEKQVEALQKDPYIGSKKKEAELYKVKVSDTILGELDSFSAKDPKVEVDNWVKEHPDQVETAAKAYEVPGATDQDVLDYLQLLMNK